MPNNILRPLLSAYLLLIGLLSGCEQQANTHAANLILYNGEVVTGNSSQANAQAVAISDNKIIYVGNNDEALSYQTDSSQTIDLAGKTVIPGLIESHAHFYNLGRGKQNLDLSDTANYQALVDKVAEAVARANSGDWIIGRGWHQSKWSPAPSPNVNGFQTHEALSAVAPDNPVYLVHASGHASFVNAKAMQLANINNTTEFTDGGEIIKDDEGNPTGVLTENASALVGSIIGEPSTAQMSNAYELAMQEALRYGITSFHDAGSDAKDLAMFHSLGESHRLQIRLYSMIDGHNDALVQQWLERGPEIGLYNNFLTVRAIKIRADGALGSRGAWLLAEYQDRPGHLGSTTVDLNRLTQITEAAIANNFQMAVHAIGDRANREVLNIFAQQFKQQNTDGQQKRFRIEHAQHLSIDDIPRFSELGVVAAMQSIHMSSDRPWAIDRLGQQRIEEGAYVWQKLLQSGAVIANGTDAPVEPLNPFANFYAAVSRKTLVGTPDGGYEPSQKMTRAQALRSMTLDAAFAAFEENIKGSIEVGKLADLAILSHNIMIVREADLLNTQVLTTIVDGKIVYQVN